MPRTTREVIIQLNSAIIGTSTSQFAPRKYGDRMISISSEGTTRNRSVSQTMTFSHQPPK